MNTTEFVSRFNEKKLTRPPALGGALVRVSLKSVRTFCQEGKLIATRNQTDQYDIPESEFAYFCWAYPSGDPGHDWYHRWMRTLWKQKGGFLES